MQCILCRVVQNRKLSESKKRHITLVSQSIYDVSDTSKETVSLKLLIKCRIILRCKQIFKFFIKTTGLLYLTNVSIEILNNVIYHLQITVLH